MGVLLGHSSVFGSRCGVSVDDMRVGGLQGRFDKLASFE